MSAAPEQVEDGARRVERGAAVRISEVLESLSSPVASERVRVGDIADRLGLRVLLILCALPQVIPLPPPGLSIVFGPPLILIAFQLALGIKHPWLPGWLSDRSIRVTDIARIAMPAASYMRRVEQMLRPRLAFLTGRAAERVFGGLCTVLALVVALPIPWGNLPPSVAIILISLGLLEKDGLFVLFGTVAALLSLLIAFGVVSIIVYLLMLVIGWLG